MEDAAAMEAEKLDAGDDIEMEMEEPNGIDETKIELLNSFPPKPPENLEPLSCNRFVESLVSEQVVWFTEVLRK